MFDEYLVCELNHSKNKAVISVDITDTLHCYDYEVVYCGILYFIMIVCD